MYLYRNCNNVFLAFSKVGRVQALGGSDTGNRRCDRRFIYISPGYGTVTYDVSLAIAAVRGGVRYIHGAKHTTPVTTWCRKLLNDVELETVPAAVVLYTTVRDHDPVLLDSQQEVRDGLGHGYTRYPDAVPYIWFAT